MNTLEAHFPRIVHTTTEIIMLKPNRFLIGCASKCHSREWNYFLPNDFDTVSTELGVIITALVGPTLQLLPDSSI